MKDIFFKIASTKKLRPESYNLFLVYHTVTSSSAAFWAWRYKNKSPIFHLIQELKSRIRKTSQTICMCTTKSIRNMETAPPNHHLYIYTIWSLILVCTKGQNNANKDELS